MNEKREDMVTENLRYNDEIEFVSESRSRKINIIRVLSIYTTEAYATVKYF